MSCPKIGLQKYENNVNQKQDKNENQDKYMEALEKASVEQDISAFVDFLIKLVKNGLEGKPVPNVPEE